jgi:DNA-binding transcriptional ArsR family regulator
MASIDFRPTTKILKALAHPTRLRLLNALRNGEECVCHLTALVRQRQAYVSQQLMFLRRAGLIEDRKEGLRIYYHVQDPSLFQVIDMANDLAGTVKLENDPETIATCPCPKCETKGQRPSRKSSRLA